MTVSDQMSPRVQAAVDYMSAHLDRRLPLVEVASVVNISRSHLCYLFKIDLGVPPGQYLTMLRMEEAARLLRTTFLSVKQVMASVGYTDNGLFSRHFKRAYGLTPLRYRAVQMRLDLLGRRAG